MYKKTKHREEINPLPSDRVENTIDGLLTVAEYNGSPIGDQADGLEIYKFNKEKGFPIGKRSVMNVHKPLRTYTRRGLDNYYARKR